jgi:hypothetical protein
VVRQFISDIETIYVSGSTNRVPRIFVNRFAAKGRVTNKTNGQDSLCILLQTDCTILEVTALTMVYPLYERKNLPIIGGDKKGVLAIILHKSRVPSAKRLRTTALHKIKNLGSCFSEHTLSLSLLYILIS